MCIHINYESLVTQGEEQVFCEIDGEVIILSINCGKYYCIDDIGSIIWNMLSTPVSVKTLCENLLEKFEVERSRCECDVLHLLQNLADEKLIRVMGHE